MRITNQQIVSQMASDLKKISDQQGNSLVKGQIFKAVVREGMQDGLLLELKNGELLRSNVADGVNLPVGSERQFEVLENEGRLLLKIVSDNGQQNIDKAIETLISSTGEKVTPEKVDAAKALLSFGQPITSENIKGLLETSKQLDTLKGLIDSNLIKLEDLPPKSPLRQILVAFYSESNTSPDGKTENIKDWTALAKVPVSDGQITGNQTDASKASQEILGQISGQSGVRLGMDTQSNGGINSAIKLNMEVENAAELLKSSNSQIAGNQELETAQVKTLQNMIQLTDVLGNVDFQKLAFHKSAGLENTLFNLAMLEKLMFGKETIGSQIQSLITELDKNISSLSSEIKSLLNELKGLNLGEEDELEKNLHKILNALDKSDQNSNKDVSQLKNEILSIRQSVSYMRELNETMTYVQFPVLIDQDIKSVDFFYKKRKKTDDNQESMTIFISLDTNNIGTVQSLIEYQPKETSIQFRVESEELVTYLEANQDVLLEKLEEIQDRVFNLSFRIKESAKTNLDTIAEIAGNDVFAIDLKV